MMVIRIFDGFMDHSFGMDQIVYTYRGSKQTHTQISQPLEFQTSGTIIGQHGYKSNAFRFAFEIRFINMAYDLVW